MYIRVLGGLAVTDDNGGRVTADDLPRRARQVLGVLAARYDRVQSKDALADAVWGDDLPGNHVAALEHYVSAIRRRLQPGQPTSDSFIVTRAGGYLFSTTRTGLDLADLRGVVRVADGHPAGSADRLRLRQQVLDLAVDLPFGDDEYADWAAAVRDEVRGAMFTALVELADSATGPGGADPERALRLVRDAIELDGYVERPYEIAMRASVALGRPDEALRWFERCRTVLDEQLGVSPSAALGQLRREILLGRLPEAPPTITPTIAPPVGPPAGARPTRPSAFLGRSAEINLILAPDAGAVIHVVGPIGAGKSALLAELGRRLPGRVGIGRAPGSAGALRLTWLRAALAGLTPPQPDPTVPAGLDRAMTEQRGLTHAELDGVASVLERTGGQPVVLAVDDATDLDAASVTELAWLTQRVPSLRVVLTYRYPSAIAGRPVAALDAGVVLRLEPLTPAELGSDEQLNDLTGGIPALLAAANAPRAAARSTAMHLARVRTRWMPPTGWEILRLTAALGALRVDQLATLTGVPIGDVLTCVDQLVHAHLVVEGSDGPIGHRSGLIRDAVAEQVSAAHGTHLRDRLAAGV